MTMGPLVLPVLGVTAIVAWWKRRALGVWLGLTEPLAPVHEAIYKTAVNTVTDPGKLGALAQGFQDAGKPVHAAALDKLAQVHATKQGKRPPPKSKPKKLVKPHESESLKLSGMTEETQGGPAMTNVAPVDGAGEQSLDKPLN
jgi:hypothetical protein